MRPTCDLTYAELSDTFEWICVMSGAEVYLCLQMKCKTIDEGYHEVETLIFIIIFSLSKNCIQAKLIKVFAFSH